MTHRRHKSKKYMQYYGEPYVAKTLKEVKVCTKCGRTLCENSQTHHCPYCGGILKTKYLPKMRGGKVGVHVKEHKVGSKLPNYK